MYCPEHLVFRSSYVSVWMYGSADIRRKFVPMKWWLNPLRYYFVFKKTLITPHMVINNEAKYNNKVRNFIFRFKQKDIK